jgi:hypothetical protein
MTRRLRGLAAMLACAGLYAADVSQAVAAPVSIGILGIDGASVEPGLGQALTDAIHRRIPSQPGGKVEKSQQDLVEVKLVFNCTDENPRCMAKAGKSLGVDRLIYGSIRKQPQGGLYLVELKQLNVADGIVENNVRRDAVPVESLQAGRPELSAFVESFLPDLLAEAPRGGLHVVSEPAGATVKLDGMPVGQTPLNLAAVNAGEHLIQIELDGHSGYSGSINVKSGLTHEVTATLPLRGAGGAGAGRGIDWHRALRITSYVAAGLAGVTAIGAIGTWRGYISDEDSASASLDNLQRRLTQNGTIGMYRGFFGSSQQLSSCGQVPTLQGDADYQAYLSSCQHGNTLAQATTGLWVVAGTFAVVSIGTALLAQLRHPQAAEHSDSGSTSPAPSTAAPAAPGPGPGPKTAGLGLRLTDLAPVVGPGGAALNATFSF